MSSKKVKSVSNQDRERLMVEHINTAIRRAEVCRVSGSPEDVLLIARSVVPLIIGRLHTRHIGPCRQLNPASILENLKSNAVIDEKRHADWLGASTGASEYGTCRSCTPLVEVMRDMQEVLAQDLRKRGFYVRCRRPDKGQCSKNATDRRPALMRWASAAVGLFTIGSQS